MFRMIYVVAAVVTAATLLFAAGQRDDPKAKITAPAQNKTKESVMKKKLTYAQQLLEGLALSDFAKLKSAADQLVELRHQPGWSAMQTRDYQVYSGDFQRELEALQKSAKNKNIDAAALAYVDMTLTCIKCHQHVREEAIGQAPITVERAYVARTK